MPRKRCACCGEWFTSDKQNRKYKNRDHYLRDAPSRHAVMVGAGRKGGIASRATRIVKAATRAAAESGLALTTRELAVYRRGAYNGYRQGFAAGKRFGMQHRAELAEKFARGESILTPARERRRAAA